MPVNTSSLCIKFLIFIHQDSRISTDILIIQKVVVSESDH